MTVLIPYQLRVIRTRTDGRGRMDDRIMIVVRFLARHSSFNIDPAAAQCARSKANGLSLRELSARRRHSKDSIGIDKQEARSSTSCVAASRGRTVSRPLYSLPHRELNDSNEVAAIRESESIQTYPPLHPHS